MISPYFADATLIHSHKFNSSNSLSSDTLLLPLGKPWGWTLLASLPL